MHRASKNVESAGGKRGGGGLSAVSQSFNDQKIATESCFLMTGISSHRPKSRFGPCCERNHDFYDILVLLSPKKKFKGRI